MSRNGVPFTPSLFPENNIAHIKDAYSLFKLISSSQSVNECLLSIVNLANLHYETPIMEFSYFSDNELLVLCEVFKNKDFIYLTQAIFYYKVYPKKLFTENLSAPKLMSVKLRFKLFYEFIELFYNSLTNILKERRLPKLPDLLLHNDALPKGIEVRCTEEERLAITEALKNFKPKCLCNSSAEIYELQYKVYIENILRSYKYWFNPDRLIDAVMILHYKLSHQGNSNDNKDFLHGVIKLYKSQNTADCLDLYGYFANKDTCYLMRTMLALKNNMHFSWIEINENKLKAISKVCDSLEIVMNALREVLLIRHIETEPYNWDISEDNISPGKRNRDAIIRVTEIYDNREFDENKKISDLFNVWEKSKQAVNDV